MCYDMQLSLHSPEGMERRILQRFLALVRYIQGWRQDLPDGGGAGFPDRGAK